MAGQVQILLSVSVIDDYTCLGYPQLQQEMRAGYKSCVVNTELQVLKCVKSSGL